MGNYTHEEGLKLLHKELRQDWIDLTEQTRNNKTPNSREHVKPENLKHWIKYKVNNSEEQNSDKTKKPEDINNETKQELPEKDTKFKTAKWQTRNQTVNRKLEV